MRPKNYSINRKKTRSKKPALALLAITLVIALVAVAAVKNNDTPPVEDGSASNKQDAGVEPSDITAVKGRYMFSGTIVLARAVENEARTSNGVDYSQPFSRFSTFNPEQYDAWEADIECPVTTNYIPYQVQVANTVFNCPPEFLPELSKYVTIANVANNHTRDQGDDGYTETVNHLEAGGLQTIGHWDPRVKEDICEVIALPVRLQKKSGEEEKSVLPVAFCAWHYFEKDPNPDEIAVMDEYAAIMPVFAFMQVGVEYRDSADPKQISIAHDIVDRGPEFLIGNSPHWVQNTESYKGKLIVYSTGNFIFDQLDAETNRGLSISADMEAAYDSNMQAWLDLAKTCQPEKRGDSCLEQAQQRNLKKVTTKLSYEPIGSSGGYRELTQLANPVLQAAIEERANWAETLKGL